MPSGSDLDVQYLADERRGEQCRPERSLDLHEHAEARHGKSAGTRECREMKNRQTLQTAVSGFGTARCRGSLPEP